MFITASAVLCSTAQAALTLLWAARVWNASQAAFKFSALPPPKQYTG